NVGTYVEEEKVTLLKQLHDSKVGGHLGISNRHVKQPMAITSTSSKPFEKIFLDITNNLYQYLITVAEAFVIHFVCVHGILGTILTDQGTDFLSKIFTEVCKLLKINKTTNKWRSRKITWNFSLYTNYFSTICVSVLEIPIKLKSESEPQHNYDDYLYGLKQ
ncbi:igE-binding protein-like, partial [Aphis craccivora]